MATSIKELKRVRAEKKNELRALLTKADVDQPLSDDDAAAATDLQNQIDAHDDRIGRLEALAEDDANDATDPSDNMDTELANKSFASERSNVLIRQARSKSEPKGTRFARFVLGAAIDKQDGRGEGAAFIKHHFGDEEVAKALSGSRYGSKAVGLNTTTVATGGALIPQDFRNELVELLYAQSIVRQSGVPTFEAPMGNYTIPKIITGSQAFWVGETDDITPSQPTFTDIQGRVKKLAMITPVSNDMMRRTPLNAEAAIRTDMIRQLALKEDLAFLSGTGGQFQPLGLAGQAALSTTPNVVTATAPTGSANTPGAAIAAVNTAITAGFQLLEQANLRASDAVWFMNPAVKYYLASLTNEVGGYFFPDLTQQDTLLGSKIYSSTQLPSNLGTGNNQTTFYLAVPGEMFIADTLQMFADSSQEASYASGGVTNGRAVSYTNAYSTDMTLFRVIEEVDFGCRHPEGIVQFNVAGWNNNGTGVAGAPYVGEPAINQGSYAESTQSS